MRILLLLNGRFPTEKAYGIQTITMAEGYAAVGHAIAIAYPRRTNEVPEALPGITFLPFGPKVRMHGNWMFPPLRLIGAMSVDSVVRDFKPDYIIANDPLQALLLSKKSRVVWELHDLPDAHRFGRAWLVRRLCKHVEAIISTNQLKLDALRPIVGTLPENCVFPNAVTFDPSVYRSIDRGAARQKLNISLDELSVVYAGQLFDWKGVDTLIKAAEEMSHSIVIHIVGGTGTDLDRCKRLAESLKQGSAGIVFHGQRPKEEVPFWLRAATVVVIPNSGRFEISVRDTSPLKLFEALAAGAAVVASDVPSIREVISTSGAVSLFSPDQESSLAKAVSDIIGDEKKLEDMRRAAEAFQVCTGKARAARIVEFLQSIRHTH
jgi:glycosyltransferase involved in cell wall biosynthesis